MIAAWPIKKKLLFVVMLSCTMALGLACGAFMGYELTRFKDDLTKDLYLLAQVLGDNTEASLVFNDAEAALETLTSLVSVPEVVGGAVYEGDGSLFVAYVRQGHAIEMPRTVGNIGYVFEDKHLSLFHPILLDGHKVGFVYLNAETTGLYARLWQYLRIGIIIMVLSTIGAFLVATRIQHTISRPIQHLADVARIISADKDYSMRAEVFSADELGVLTEAINDMLGQIQQRDQALQDQASEMARIKQAFLGNMSHEIRTPVAGIVGCAQVLREELQGEQRELAALMEESGGRLMETLDSMLNLARLQAREWKPNFEIIDLVGEVGRVSRALAPLASRKNLTLELDLPNTPIQARLEKVSLGRILTNLLGNAIKFTHSGGILVRVYAQEDVSVIEVTDTGIGISEDFLPHIFEEFRQESTGEARSHEGIGLGLNLTYRLVQLMDGTIAVASQQGEGTTFLITFPTYEHLHLSKGASASSPNRAVA